MNITLNGEVKQVEEGITLLGIIQSLGLNPDTMVAEYNGRIITRPEFDGLVLDPDSRIELIRFVGGG